MARRRLHATHDLWGQNCDILHITEIDRVIKTDASSKADALSEADASSSDDISAHIDE
jgi:hypothetical protein